MHLMMMAQSARSLTDRAEDNVTCLPLFLFPLPPFLFFLSKLHGRRNPSKGGPSSEQKKTRKRDREGEAV